MHGDVLITVDVEVRDPTQETLADQFARHRVVVDALEGIRHRPAGGWVQDQFPHAVIRDCELVQVLRGGAERRERVRRGTRGAGGDEQAAVEPGQREINIVRQSDVRRLQVAFRVLIHGQREIFRIEAPADVFPLVDGDRDRAFLDVLLGQGCSGGGRELDRLPDGDRVPDLDELLFVFPVDIHRHDEVVRQLEQRLLGDDARGDERIHGGTPYGRYRAPSTQRMPSSSLRLRSMYELTGSASGLRRGGAAPFTGRMGAGADEALAGGLASVSNPESGALSALVPDVRASAFARARMAPRTLP